MTSEHNSINEAPRVSIVITSYNYGRYVGQAIDSALEQSYPHTEVIVVDDGSSDHSPEVISAYGRRIIAVLKENGGQGSAFNAGFTRSQGQIVLFLDSDDALLPTTVARVVDAFQADPEAVKVHWPLWIIDEHGNKTGKIKQPKLPEGDFRALLMSAGPMTEATLPSAPTSGNAYVRAFLEQVLPMPEAEYRISPDAYLFGLAPAFGRIKKFLEPQGLWRFHGHNASKGTNFADKLRNGVADYKQQYRVLSNYYRQQGIDVDTEAWRGTSWWSKIDLAIQEITSLIPEESAFILVDQGAWGTDTLIAGRRRFNFIERDGHYWGRPVDDAAALDELARLRAAGAQFIVFAWPAFWWLAYYAGLARYLHSHFQLSIENDRLLAFDLRHERQPPLVVA